jgi:hypothetical protein
MVNRLVLLAVLVVVSILSAPVAAAADSPCTRNQIIAGTCPTVGGEIVDGGVRLDGKVGAPGSGNGGGNDTGHGTGNGTGGGAPVGTTPGGTTPWQPGIIRDGYTVTGPITLSDLVNFRPTPGSDHMEPDGWMVVGLDTNFYARAGVHVQDGLLLGEPASVRFTPVRYHWAYGDGLSASLSTPGTTWRAHGVSEFAPTPTSHVYTARGTYYIDLTIDFAAEYRWAGGPWTSIAGSIPVVANRLVATAGGAKTVLVEHECTLNPRGPGC